LYNADAFIPSGGPLDVTYSNYAQSFSTWLEGGFEEAGRHRAVDFNSGKLEGYQYCSSTIRPSDQHRSSSEWSFLNQRVPGLTVYTDTLAKRVIFDDELNAVEVEVSHRGFKRNFTASREIIISAGVFHSPQLLMVSGIGPRQHLENHGIEVLVERPAVGQDMWDHPFVGPSYRVNVEKVTKLANSPTYLASKYLRWARKQLGPFTNPVSDILAWEKTPYELRKDFSTETLQALSQFPDDWPEVEVS
jgi:choline dehydrogenase-like flavoprotein